MFHPSAQIPFVLAVSLLFSVCGEMAAQENQSAGDSPKASINDVAWIAGDWRGEAMGGEFSETWTQPMGGTITGVFTFTREGKVVFYEFLSIMPAGDSLTLRLKHFHPDMKGWEEKDTFVEFPLVSITEDTIRFDGLVFEKKSDSEMSIRVTIDQGQGPTEVLFPCKRYVDHADAIRKVLEQDALISGQRNEATRHCSLAASIQTYITGLDMIDYSECPAEFARAFQKHREAWQDSVEFFRRHETLRGEMHELFDTIRGGDDADELDKHFRAIMETWGEVEAAMSDD